MQPAYSAEHTYTDSETKTYESDSSDGIPPQLPTDLVVPNSGYLPEDTDSDDGSMAVSEADSTDNNETTEYQIKLKLIHDSAMKDNVIEQLQEQLRVMQQQQEVVNK